MEVKAFRAGYDIFPSVFEKPHLAFDKLREYRALNLDSVMPNIRIVTPRVSPIPDFFKPEFLSPDKFSDANVPGEFVSEESVSNSDIPTESTQEGSFSGSNVPGEFVSEENVSNSDIPTESTQEESFSGSNVSTEVAQTEPTSSLNTSTEFPSEESFKQREAFFGAGLPDIFLLVHIICVLFVNLFFKKYFTSYKIVDVNIGFLVVGLLFVIYLL